MSPFNRQVLPFVLATAWCAICAAAHGEEFPDFDLYYDNFQAVEEATQKIRAEDGDLAYLEGLFSYRYISNIATNYRLFGDHPERQPPHDTKANAHPSEKGLAACRVFAARHYFHLWAASLALRDDADVMQSMEDRLRFLVSFHREDVEIQKLTKELVSRYGGSETVVIAGLSGAEIVKHMEVSLERLKDVPVFEPIGEPDPDDPFAIFAEAPQKKPPEPPEPPEPREPAETGSEPESLSEGRLPWALITGVAVLLGCLVIAWRGRLRANRQS